MAVRGGPLANFCGLFRVAAFRFAAVAGPARAAADLPRVSERRRTLRSPRPYRDVGTLGTFLLLHLEMNEQTVGLSLALRAPVRAWT